VNYEAYIQGPAWAKRRAKAIRRAEGRCQLCNSKRQLTVHHRTYDRLGDERDADLTVLCRNCHERFHGITKAEAVPVKSAPALQAAPAHLRPLRDAAKPIPGKLAAEPEVRWAIARWGAEPFTAKDLAKRLRAKDVGAKHVLRVLERLAYDDEIVRVGTKHWQDRSATSQGGSVPSLKEHAQPAGERCRP
jgi:hypothetical protein